MTAERTPIRIVDSHIHLWDPANTAWYPYLSMAPSHGGTGDPERMNRRFDVGTYRAESAAWNVEGFVNVAAATGPNSVEETIELDRTAAVNGGPDAIVGGLPPTETVAGAIALIDRQMAAARFRGVRPMGPLGDPVPDRAVLSALEDRNLVFELMTHPDLLATAAQGLAGFEELVIVVEHTGWPRSGAEEEFDLWRRGMDALAALGENVVCKLSGLAMPLGSMRAEAMSPWIDHALEVFGPSRCMFGSNFPVDAMAGTFDELLTGFVEATSGLDGVGRDQVFAGTARRVYRV
jgi:L-fuconolactonase